MTKELSLRQFIVLMMALYLGLAFVNVPSFYAKNAGVDCWLVYILAQTVQLVIITAVCVMYYKCPDESIYGLLKGRLGVIVAKAIMSILCLFFLYKFVLGLGISFKFYTENIFEQGNYFLFGILVLPFLLYANIKGMRSMGRFAEITFMFSLVATIMILILGIYSADIVNLGPVLKDGPIDALKSLRFFLSSSGDILPLIMMCGKLDKAKKAGMKIFAVAIICILMGALFLAVFIACYGNSASYLINAPGHIGELPLEMLGIGKLEWILILMYSIFSYIKLFLFLFGACSALKNILPVRSTNPLVSFILILVCAPIPVFFPDFEFVSNAIGLFALLFLIPVLAVPLLCICLPKKFNSQIIIGSPIQAKLDNSFVQAEKAEYRSAKAEASNSVLQARENSEQETPSAIERGVKRLKDFFVKKTALLLVMSLCLISFGYFITGKNVTNLLIVSGMGIDQTESGYELTLNVLSPSPPDSGNSYGGHLTLSGKGKSLETALNDIKLRTDKTPNIDKCSVIVLGKSVYESNVLDVFSALLAKNVQHNIIVVASENDAKSVIQARAPFDEFVASPLSSTLLSNKTSAYTSLVTMRKLIGSLYSKSASALVPLVKLTDLDGNPISSESGQDGQESGSEENSQDGQESGNESSSEEGSSKNEEKVLFDFKESIVLKNGQLSAQLTKEETAGYNFLYSRVKDFALEIDDKHSAVINITSRKICHKLVDGKPVLEAILCVRLATLQTLTAKTKEEYLDSLGTEINDDMRERVSEAVKSYILQAIAKQATINGDFLSLNTRFYSKYGNSWTSPSLSDLKLNLTVHCAKFKT